MNDYTWLLFDADGTLFDYDKAETRALMAAFGAFGRTFTPAILNTYRSINERYWKKFERREVSISELTARRFADLFDTLGLIGDPAAFNESYLDHLSRQTHLNPGVEQVIPALARDYRLAVLTNGVARVQRSRLKASSIGRYFKTLVVSEDVGASKPSREYFDAAFTLLGNPHKDRVLMIGDSLSSDILGAIGYGIHACWYNPSGAVLSPGMRVQAVIRDLNELTTLLLE